MSKNKELQQPDPGMYNAKQALVVYATRPPKNTPPKYYVEVCDIMQDGKQAYIGAGKPVTKDSMQMLMDIVAESDKQTYYSITEIVPSNLLILDQRAGQNVIAWWKAAERQTIIIKGKASFTCWVPPLVFIVRNDRLAVAALNKNKKPGIGTRLCHAPFFNIYTTMNVCLGNVKPPKTSGDIRELLTEWEKAFWKSEFTETVTGQYSRKDLYRWWRKKRRGKFNLKKLKVSSTNLKTLCQNL